MATPAPPRLASLYLASFPDEARAVLAEGAAEVGVCAWRLEEPGGAWDALLPELTLVLDEVCRPGDAERALGLRAGAGVKAAHKVVCRNLGQVDAVRASGLAWEAAAPINVWNAEGARWLAGLGAGRIWLSEELSDEAVDALLHAAGGTVRFGRIVGPRRQLMVTEHCALTAEGPCDGPCLSCPRRAAASAGDRFLVGADGVRLPVEVDAGGRTRIFEQPLIGACHR